jgi:Beta-propeller repeat
VFDPSGSTEVFDLVVDGSDNLYISVFDGVLVRGGAVRKLTNTGATIWTQRVEPVATSISAKPRALAVDKDNNVYVTGETSAAYPGFSNKGFSDIFVLKLSAATGLRLWTQQLGGNSTDVGFGVAVSDAVYVAGKSSSSRNLVGDPGYGGDDAYLAQLDSATGTLLGIDQ